MRSAGNIWKKLKKQRKESCLKREGLGSWVEVWGGSWGDSLLHRNLPFRVQLHLELHQAGGIESSPSGCGAGTPGPRAKARWAGTYILSRNVLRGALAVSGCLARASTSSAQSCRTTEPSGQAHDHKGFPDHPTACVSQGVQAIPGVKTQARCSLCTLPTFSL